MACQGAIEKLGWPLDRVVHAEVWATETIPADFPSMVEFKAKADKVIKQRYGIEVEHICATRREREREKVTYQDIFYQQRKTGKYIGQIYGFPMVRGPWCQDRLKANALDKVKSLITETKDVNNNIVQYIGIAVDEPERLARLDGVTKISPLAAIGWTEADARLWCEENDLLSPIYTTATRGGCWFCHNQSIDQLRLLRKNYPDLWALLLKWDNDSPVSFKPNGRSVHDLEDRFHFEDIGLITSDSPFRWKTVDLLRNETQSNPSDVLMYKEST